jgi:hypothetical protein
MSYARKRPSAVLKCPHEGCMFGRIKFYDETPDGVDKARAYFSIFRSWLNHEKRRHRGHISFDRVGEGEGNLLCHGRPSNQELRG